MYKLVLIRMIIKNILIGFDTRINIYGHKYAIILCRIVLLSTLLFYSTDCYSENKVQIIKVGAEKISFQNLIDDISNARIIFIGESHDNKLHHMTQLDIIKALHERKYPLAIGLEMFMEKDQKILDRWVTKDMNEREFIQAFYRNWGVGWGLYKDIFLYARDNSIPLIGLNVPKEITRKVGEHGFQSLSREEHAKLPPAVTCDVDERYMELLQKIFEIKEHDKRKFKNFCEAQILWDQAMAWYLYRYLLKDEKRIVVVLSGSIHAWKFGIPRQLKRFINSEQRIILLNGFTKMSTDYADYLIIYK